MSVYFLGDAHLGHRAIGKYRPWVKDSNENSQMIHAQWQNTILKNDIVYVMGDIAFTEEELLKLGNLRGRKILLKGNHDLVPTQLQAQIFEEIHGVIKYKGMWLSHAPMHPAELRGKPNAHGHVHAKTIRTWYGAIDKRYYNTCVDVVYPKTGNIFVKLETLKDYFGIK
jgi:calcineurin-like phosphoesterase family protein